MIAKAQRFQYKIIETYPLSDLEKYKDHPRLRVFYHKGCECINCGHVFTQLALGIDNGGGKHIDVYDDDFYPLTIDHTIPKSKGGSNHLENLEPFCYDCNNQKGNGEKQERIAKPLDDINNAETQVSFYLENHKDILVKGNGNMITGDKVYKKIKGSKFKMIGEVSELCINSHINKKAFKVVGNEISMFSVSRFYVEKKV